MSADDVSIYTDREKMREREASHKWDMKLSTEIHKTTVVIYYFAIPTISIWPNSLAMLYNYQLDSIL